MKRVLALAAVSLLFLAACGDDGGDVLDGGADGDTATTEPAGDDTTTTAADDEGDEGDEGDGGSVVDAVKESLIDPDTGIAIDEDDAQCSAEAIVDALGEERAAEIDWEAADVPFTAEESEAVVDAFGSCVPLNELLVQFIVSGADVADSSRECVEAEVSEEDARTFLVAGFTSGSEGPPETLITEIDALLQECLTEEEYAAI